MQERHKAIQSIISEELVPDQATLQALLKTKFDISVTQVQISRDLKKLGIGKKKVGNQMVYELPSENPSLDILRLAIADVTHNETTIVVKTMGGLAPFVGDQLDAQMDLGIIGTLAGENVVLVIPSTIKEIKTIYNNVCKALYFKRKS